MLSRAPSLQPATPASVPSSRAGAAAPLAGARVLAVSPTGAYRGNNTSLHRVRALESLGADVDVVDTAADEVAGLGRLRYRVQNRLFLRGWRVPLPDVTRTAERIIEAARRRHWDIIWLEKALAVGPGVVRELRNVCPRARIIGFSPDDMCLRHNQSQQFLQALPGYDWFITTKADTVPELAALGCTRVVAVGNGFDPEAFRPMTISSSDVERLGGDIGFVGTYERERAALVLRLAEAGLGVRVWGDGWRALTSHPAKLRIENEPLDFVDYAKACSAFKINLGFLRKLNRDQQTTRSVEIPACGGFMLAERTGEHLALFDEGTEAEFFAGADELIEKSLRFLADDAARAAIARRGHERCVSSGYSNAARLRQAFAVILAGAPIER
jgi:spore maturation protein CgeB